MGLSPVLVRAANPVPEYPTAANPAAIRAQPKAHILAEERFLVAKLGSCEKAHSSVRGTKDESLRLKFRELPDEAEPFNAMQVLGKQAVLRMELFIDPLGNIRFVHPVLTAPVHPDPEFVSSATTWIQTARVVLSKARPLSQVGWHDVTILYTQAAPGDFRPMGDLLKQRRWDQLLVRANKGDVASLQVVAYISTLLYSKDSGLTAPEYWKLLATAAVDGDRFSQLQIARQLTSCHESALVDPWVFAAAKAENPDAEADWAAELIQAGDPTYYPKAAELLQKAARKGNAGVRLWVAGLLATSPISGLRDPSLALQLAKRLRKESQALAYVMTTYDPDQDEVLAAAFAANGRFADAVRFEQIALRQAMRLHWNIERLRMRLSAYQSHRAWRGYLCDCDHLTPPM